MRRDGSKSRHLANSADSAETLANEVTGNGGDTTANAAGPGVPTAELLLSALAPKVPRGVLWDRLPTSPNKAELGKGSMRKRLG